MSAAPLKFSYSTPPTVVRPGAKHTGTVILLHGLGDSADGWADAAEQLGAAAPHIKWILPTAPTRPISCNGGFRMTGWFDIKDIGNINAVEDDEGIKDAAKFIERLIVQEQSTGIPPSRIVVAGFSQGGAMALMMLRSHFKLAAIIGLSAYIPLRNEAVLVSDEAKSVPVFMAHGIYDTTVRFEYGKQSADVLSKLGTNVTFKEYPMQHSACEAELLDVAAFLARVLPSQ